MLTEKTLGFLGAGSMTTALVQGLLQAGLVRAGQILVANRSNRERLMALHNRFGVRTTPSRRRVVEKSDIVVVAAKPKDIAELFLEVGPVTRSGQVVLSLAAGIGTASLLAQVAPGVQVVRAMPNTSCFVRESATAFCLGAGAGPEAAAAARTILEAVGKVEEVPEHLLDAVTGLSGSGPAYVYLLIETMIEAGTRVGLPQHVADTLAKQTVLGAAKMLIEAGADPAELRRQVTSPGGTTQAGLQVLAEQGFQDALINAIVRATQRSRELGLALQAPPATATGTGHGD